MLGMGELDPSMAMLPSKDWMVMREHMMAKKKATIAGGKEREGKLELEDGRLGFWNERTSIVMGISHTKAGPLEFFPRTYI